MLRQKKKRVLIWESLSDISGGQRVLLNILPFLRDNFLLSVIVPARGAMSMELDKLGVKFIIIPNCRYNLINKKTIDYIKYLFFAVINILIAPFWFLKSDLIYINSTRILPFAYIASLISRKPIIWHVHSYVAGRVEQKIINHIAKSKLVKKIIVVSRALGEKIVAPANKVVVIYNGINLDRFCLCSKEPERKIKFAIIGDIIPEKGHLVAIKALKKSLINFDLYVVGKNRIGYQFYVQELKKLITELNLDPVVHFLGERSDIERILCEVDCVLIPSIVFESFSLVAIESMASGRPVIGSDVGGIPEVIGLDSGYVFKLNNENDLAQKIIDLSQADINRRKLMQASARQRAVELFDVKVQGEKIGALIEQLL